ncbi:MAG: beta-phosphoglucomutase [Proteobacteria bacterium]|nr:beta-phosphoglucomutase [Pseudomonadota bacterium]
MHRVAGADCANDDRRVDTVDPWLFTQTSWRLDRTAHDETLFALANGALGVRGGIEESASPSQGSFLAEVWERSPIAYHERHSGFAQHSDTRVPVADATALRVRCNGDVVDPALGECLAFERTLDFRGGCLSRSQVWRSAQGIVFRVTAQRIVSLRQPGLACLRWTLCLPESAAAVEIDACILSDRVAAAQGSDPRFGAGSGLALRVTQAHADATQAWLAQHTLSSGIGIVCAQRQHVCGARFVRADCDAHGVRQTYAAEVAAGTVITIEKCIAYAWTQPHVDESDTQLHARACATLDAAATAGAGTLFAQQRSDCERFWADADFAIDGAAPAKRDEQALRFNLFHLFQAAGRDGRNGISAKGLTGEGYEGHVFWDAEAMVLPVLALVAPALMQPSLVWRYRGLDRARAHAREMNHARGALYPWRTIGGDECSGHYPSGSAQYHINAAVAYAIRLYVDASGDRAFLAAMGAEMLAETARIWLDVGHFNPRRGGAFCIHTVTGPDEYTALVDNNYYTNRMAQEHLRYAAATLRELAVSDAVAHAALTQRIGLEPAEIDAWSRAADAMYLGYDDRLGIIAQDDSFLDKPVWDLAGTPAEKYPLLMHFHPLTLYRHQVCKQADAVLALVMAGENVDRDTKRRTFDYYDAVTVHDSTLSASAFAVLAAEVGYVDQAQRFFRETLRVDLDDLQGNVDHGAHLAALAGSWLAFAWGFAGLRVRHPATQAVLEFDPILPEGWDGFRFGLVWQDRRLRVAVDAAGARYSLVSGDPLPIRHAGTVHELQAGVTRHVALRESPRVRGMSARVRFPRPFKAVIFDLDGVLADTASLHLAAWQRLARELGLPWDRTAAERLKGVDRAASLEIVLGSASGRFTGAQKTTLAERKNGYYRDAIAALSPRDLLPGAASTLGAVRKAGLKIGLASASRSARDVVERLGIAALVDHVVDAATVVRAKPDPEIFQRAAAALDVHPAACLGIEDAQAGVAAIKAAGMAAIGIGDPQVLRLADAVLPDLTYFEVDTFVLCD